MADWKTVRYDPDYPEPLDSEVIPLCDALNASGLVTICSCYGHGQGWPHVCMTGDVPDSRYESLQRFLLANAAGCPRSYLPVMLKDITEIGFELAPCGHYWDLEIHANEVYCDTSRELTTEIYADILAYVTMQIADWETYGDAKG